MYYFNNKNDHPLTHPPLNDDANDNVNSNNNHSNPLFSQSFDPSTLHQPQSLDNNYSFFNFGNDAHNSLPPSAFLQDGSSSSLGHDSLLAQGWEGMYDSNFGDNNPYDHQSNMMYMPLTGLDQQHQQEQHHHQSFDHHDNFHKQLHHPPPQQQGNSDFFLSLTEQEQQAILMSEPNFLRQQHLLQDKEVKMKMEENEDEQQQNKDHGDAGTPMRSNLSAMFDQSTPPPQPSMDTNLLSSSVPSTHTNTDMPQQQLYGHQSMQHTISFDDDRYQQRQQQQQESYAATPTTIAKSSIPSTSAGKVTPSSTKSRKETNRRSQQGSVARGNNRANPIPISGGGNVGSGSKNSSSVPSEIDHQRRFNELQARFRVNYARKPTTGGGNTSSTSASSTPSLQHQSQHNYPLQQQQQQMSINTSSPSTTTTSSKQLSSSFSGTTNGFGNHVSHGGKEGNNGGTSIRTSTEKTPAERASVNTETDNNTDRSNDKVSTGAGISSVEKGTAIQKTDNNNTSTNGGGKQASSFPSRTMPIQIQRVHRANSNQPMDAEQHQKRLDDQLVKANFDDITVSELKEMLRQRGKPATGKKAILLQRLVEEREVIKAVRGGRITHRHSQPPPPTTPTMSANPSSLDSNNNNTGASPRPRSYQGSSPMFAHTNLPPNSPLLESPSSVPNSSMFLSSSPGSVTLSLNRSIANMHIGSPPMSSQHVRRFSPYGTPGSPRLGSASSPKMQRQAYSSSVPNDYLSSSPNGGALALPPSFGNFVGNDGYNNTSSNNASSPMSPGPPNSTRNMRLYHQSQNWNGRQKSYAPFTSSALATPDRDDDDDPFDVMAREQDNVDMDNAHQLQQLENPVQSQPLYDSLYELQQQQAEQYHQNNGMDTDGVKEEPMEWVNNNPSTNEPSLNGLLQELPEGVSIEQFMAWFSTMNGGANDLGQFNLNMDAVKTETVNLPDMMSMDPTHYSDSPTFDHHRHQNGGTDNTA